MESMLNASLGLLLPPVEAVVAAAGAAAVGELTTDTTKGFDGAIGSMLNV